MREVRYGFGKRSTAGAPHDNDVEKAAAALKREGVVVPTEILGGASPTATSNAVPGQTPR